MTDTGMRFLLISDTHRKLGVINDLAARGIMGSPIKGRVKRKNTSP